MSERVRKTEDGARPDDRAPAPNPYYFPPASYGATRDAYPTQPPMPLLGRHPGTQVFRELDENPGDETFPGIAVLRLDGGLFFATAEALEDRIRELPQDGRRALVLDLEGVNFVDSQGSAKVAEIHRLTESDGVTLRLARVKPQVLSVLRADGVVDLVGADRIHGSVHHAVEAQLAASA